MSFVFNQFTRYLEDMVREFYLKTMGEAPVFSNEQCSLGLWCLNDRARGALLLEFQRVTYLLRENYLRGQDVPSEPLRFEDSLRSDFYPLLRKNYSSLTACLTPEQRLDRRMYDVALCLEIYVLSTELCEEFGEKGSASHMTELLRLISELSVSKCIPHNVLPDFEENYPTPKEPPQSLGGKRHSIKKDIVNFIRCIPSFQDKTASECWNYLECRYSKDEYLGDTYSFYFVLDATRQNDMKKREKAYSLVYSWYSESSGVQKEKQMLYKTFENWVTKAKKSLSN